MNKCIIYLTSQGGLAIIIPTQEALANYGIEAIALKDVPTGLPFKIIDASDIPIDRTQRNLWTVDEADLTDGIGADYDTFPEE